MTAFDDLFPIVAYKEGPSYVDARDTLLGWTGVPRDALVKRLGDVLASGDDWQARLGAEILLGWMNHRHDFVMCAIYARGDRVGVQSIAGYRPSDRAGDIAARGPAVTPRVLELLLKTAECTGEAETDALFSALVFLADPRAEAMATLSAQTAPRDLRGGALRVLAALDDPRAVEAALKIMRDRYEPLPLRIIATCALGATTTAGGGAHLLRFLEPPDLPAELRQAAAEALYRRADPTTRQGLIEALTRVQDQAVLPTLLLAIGEVATEDDTKLLANYAAVAGGNVEAAVRKTIVRIERRLRMARLEAEEGGP